jgi:hypothetical protein
LKARNERIVSASRSSRAQLVTHTVTSSGTGGGAIACAKLVPPPGLAELRPLYTNASGASKADRSQPPKRSDGRTDFPKIAPTRRQPHDQRPFVRRRNPRDCTRRSIAAEGEMRDERGSNGRRERRGPGAGGALSISLKKP